MGTIDSVTKRLNSERRDVVVSFSISAEDSKTLDEFVDFLGGVGVTSVRSGAARALLLDGLEEFRKFKAQGKGAANTERDAQ